MIPSRSSRVPLRIIDGSHNAKDRWLGPIAGPHPISLQLIDVLDGPLDEDFNGIWLLVVGEWCRTDEMELMLSFAATEHPEHLVLALTENTQEMPEVPGTVWLPLDTSDAEIHRWLTWMARVHQERRSMELALKFPVDNPNPVACFDDEEALVFANSPARDLFPRTDAEGTRLVDLLRQHLKTFLAQPEVTGECMVSVPGSTTAFRLVRDAQESLVHVYGIDISKSMQTEMEKSRLQQNSQNKDAFLRSMSHELRTPLNAVLACTEALREGAYGSLEPAQTDAIQSIRTSGKHLLTLINNVLDVSKIEAGCLQLEASPMSVQALVESVVQIVQANARSKSIQLLQSNNAEEAVLTADPLRIRQILINLLGNAVKFTPDGGQVGLDVTTTSGEISFRIWDTGPGVPANESDVIFEPFVQLHNGHGNEHPGTGLGLALARQLAQLHGGDVTLEAFDVPGAAFTLSLPLGDAGSNPVVDLLTTGEWFLPEDDATVDGTIESVLIAEDTDSNYQHTRDLLTSLGYRVDRAFDGQEAIELCRDLRPDVVLMDIDMPVMNGLDAIRLIREDAKTHQVPIIAVTAMASISDEQACLQAGADAYLPKPFALRALMSAMSSLVA